MKNWENSMTKILFVCYHHGCRGERLSVNLSQHKAFETLEAESVNGRTVIKNDHFGKKFLKSWTPDFEALTNFPNNNIVVPSHLFYDRLVNYFPNALYVAIDIPKDLAMYRQSLYERFFQYKTKNIAELAGECENRIREYNPGASQDEINDFTRRVLQTKGITFGEIRCMAKGIDPSKENQINLLKNHTPRPLSAQTKAHSLVIPYEEVDGIDRNYVISYFNK